jgi:preprotein translocase subunit YajC
MVQDQLMKGAMVAVIGGLVAVLGGLVAALVANHPTNDGLLGGMVALLLVLLVTMGVLIGLTASRRQGADGSER